MPFSLIPHRVFDRYGDITTEYLREQNITLLLSDLDFTLAAKSTRRPDQALRDWINEQTHGLLAEQAEGLRMEPDTALALASTIYFKAAWDSEFSKERTETDTFHAPAGDVDADFMRRTMESSFYWGGQFHRRPALLPGGRRYVVPPPRRGVLCGGAAEQRRGHGISALPQA